MQDSHCRIIVISLLCMITHMWTTNAVLAGVCYRSFVTRHAYTSYYPAYYSQGYYASCGWLGWSRCHRTRTLSRAASRYNPTTYSTQSYCCPGYSGTPNSCSPICTNKCVHGTCTRPNVCTCQAAWRGSTCRDDTNLINWCNSIKNRNINNGYRGNIRSNVKVYCGSVTSTSYITYNSANADYVATRMKADSNRCTTSSYKPALYELWKQHANIRGHCCFSNTKYYITLLNSLMNYDANFYQLVGCLTSSVAVELRKELVKLCSSSLSDQFCPIKPALDIIDVSAKLPSNKSQWTTHTEDHKTAILVHFAVLKKNYPTEFAASLSVNENKIITDATNTIFKLVHANNVENLEKFLEFLPDNGALNNSENCQGKQLCLLMKTIEQVRLFIDEANQDSNPPTANGKKRFVLNTAVDYRKILEQKQLDRIITVLSKLKSSSTQIANDLKKHATTQFTELKAYFETIETFNQEIAETDIELIKGRIERYEKSMRSTVSRLKWDMTFLQIQTGLGVALDIEENVVASAMEIATAFNPLKLLMDGTSSSDILRATTDFEYAINDTEEFTDIFYAFIDLRKETINIAQNIEMNDNFLHDVKNIIYQETVTREEFAESRDRFLESYNDYSPAIKKLDIDDIGALWDALVDNTCELVDKLDTADAVNDKGYCLSLPKEVAKLVTLYEEIYDYQFDLINAMGSYVRSSVALDAAKEINAEFTEITKLDVNQDSTLDTLQIMGVLTYVAYRVHVIETVHLYCNVLEYMERGVRPKECKGIDTNVALLLASTPPICRSSTLQFYHVPTAGTGKSFVDLDDLFAGKEVPFQVPSADWLVENDWIHPSERNYTFYVKRFEVYLPIKPEVPLKLISTAIPVIYNTITPAADSTEYILIPNPHMVYEHMTGPSTRLYCHHRPIKNPYTVCETTDVSEVCKLSLDIKQRMYPSLYSQWAITVKGGEDLTVPKPNTDMTAIFGMQLCKVAPNGEAQIEDDARGDIEEDNTCCERGTYRMKFNSASCDSCPDGSRSALAGYYCEEEEYTHPTPASSMQK